MVQASDPSHAESVWPVLVIGYGNELRGDDGLGPKIARAIDAWGLPGVRVIVAHQLVPEQAEALAASQAVIFIDASLDSAVSGVSVTAMAPGREQPNDGHVCNPQGLLVLCRAVYGKVPKAWWVCVRADDVGFGTGLSPRARERMKPALARLRRLLGSIRCMK